ncbi:Methyltransferase [Aspergillus sp. HF37]|nr:Methyltransferase [Aspergillus sp. HF37]
MAAPAPSTAPEEPTRDPAAHIEIVPDDDPYAADDPSFLTDSDKASSTQSLSSSVLNYQYENGRRYHAYREGEYMVPNDDKEQDRMDLLHHIYRLTVGGALFRAPIDPSTARILDLGTGTGIWAIEMADDFPSADVIGTDLSPIQPKWVPPNCYFEVDDYESEWGFSKPFDFIHGRNLAGSIRDMSMLYQRIMNNLKPGGWVEIVDFAGALFSDDDSMEKAPFLTKWCTLQQEAFRKFGKDIGIAGQHKQRMIDAGFTNVKEEVYKVPVNPWPKDRRMKDLGRYNQVNVLEGLEAYTLASLTRVLGWDMQEVETFFAGVRKELVDRSLHVYVKFYFIYGQKEEAEESLV